MSFCSIDYANKLVKRLQQLQSSIINQESSTSVYSHYFNEEPIIPEYNFAKTQTKINAIEDMIITIKHEVRVANMAGKLKNFSDMSVDEAILKLAFLNKRKTRLERLANTIPEHTRTLGGAKGSEIYKANFDVKEAKSAYHNLMETIAMIQDELNIFNVLTQVKIPDSVNDLFD